MSAATDHRCCLGLHKLKLPPFSKLKRPLMLLSVLVGLAVLAAALELDQLLSADRLKALLADGGFSGLAIFTGAFSLGVLLYLPGMMFVGLAGWLYGPVGGPVVALVTGVVAVTISFAVYRTVGGKALSGAKGDSKIAAKMDKWLSRMKERPVMSVAALRLFFWVGPPLNTALALTDIRWRDYIVGSLLGLVLPVSIGAWIGAAAA